MIYDLAYQTGSTKAIKGFQFLRLATVVFSNGSTKYLASSIKPVLFSGKEKNVHIYIYIYIYIHMYSRSEEKSQKAQ